MITTAHQRLWGRTGGSQMGMWLDMPLSVAGKFVAKLDVTSSAPLVAQIPAIVEPLMRLWCQASEGRTAS